MHTAAAAKSYLPSHRMYASVGAGMVSPTLSPTSAASLPLLKQTQTSPPFREAGEKTSVNNSSINNNLHNNAAANSMAASFAQAYSRASQSGSMKLQTAASLVYAARMRQEAFPYGISGVPSMPSYNYSNELYGYASNGFPRKSRICSYCSKVFTRSTTRRYHEKRCPLLRAAGSLMKGAPRASAACNGYTRDCSDNSGYGQERSDGSGYAHERSDNSGYARERSDSTGFAREHSESGGYARERSENSGYTHERSDSSGYARECSSSAGYTREHADNSVGGTTSSHASSALTVVTNSAPPSLPASKSTSVNTSPTSEGLASLARAQALSASQFYSMYGSHFNRTTVSTSTETLADVPPIMAGRQAILDHNQNSILPAVKQEPEFEGGDHAKVEQSDRDSFLLRSKPQGEEQSQSQLMFTPLSPTSRSRSEEEEAESDDGEQKHSAMTVQPEDENYIKQLALKRYKLAQLMALRNSAGMTHAGNMLLPVPCVTGMTGSSEKLPREPEAQSLSPQKEEESLPDNDPNLEDDDKTETYYYTPNNLEAEEVYEEEEEDEEEEEKKCGICNEDFEEKENLRIHKRVHQKYKPNSCRYCGHRFIKVSMRIAHQRKHSGRYSLGCVVCGLHVLTKFGLRQHVHREHYHLSVGETECRYCHLIIDNVYDLRVHFMAHRQQIVLSERKSIRFLRSPLPALVVSPLEEEASHELPPASIDSKASQDSPTDIESVPPPLLGPIMPMSSELLEQSTMRANGGMEYVKSRDKDWCRICEKEVPKSAMRYHEREHADQKPYECSLCKKRFGYKNNMKSHMKLHAGIKPYQCQVCGAKFTRGSTLRRHARRHGFRSDTIWDFFIRKNAASRTAVYNQGLNHAVTTTPERQAQSQVSPMGSGAQGMQVDVSHMTGPKNTEIACPEKSCQPTGYSPNSSAPHAMMNVSYPAVPAAPPAMLQPCMTPQQYLRFATGFSSAAPPPPPQAMEADEALDFSMPDKQRRRSSSSSSSISTQRCPSNSSLGHGVGYPMSAAMERSPSALGQTQMSHCQSLPATMDRRRSMGSYGEEQEIQEERRRNTISFHGAYNQFNKHRPNRATLRETLEHRLEPGTGGHAVPHKPNTHDASTQDTLCCVSSAAQNKEHYQKFVMGGCNPLDMTMSSRMGSAKSSPWVDNIEAESLESLTASGRLFHCRPCDCYYTDLTMYRLHRKIHVPDHPFLCFLCREDCQDKVTFSRHMLAHLR